MPADRARQPSLGWPEGFAEGPRERDAALVLSSLAGLTAGRLLSAANAAGTATACLALVRGGELGSQEDRRLADLIEPGAVTHALEACGARFVSCDDPGYPSQLRTIHDPPLGLFVRGGPLPDVAAAVAIVGARRCSDLGREVAWSIGRGLGAAGVAVVSGAARGIDSAAHEGALEAQGQTIAVLGCGIDLPYPPGSRRLLARIAEAGALVSEYPPGVPPRPFRFPARNRIVAGLCRGTVVVEGAEGSGSLITGEHALEFGREVYAVPGAVNNPLAAVPLALIRDGATMIGGVQDLLEDLGFLGEEGGRAPSGLTIAERAALDALTGPTLPERVAAALDVDLADAVGLLVELEMRGLVRSVGGRFEPTLAGSGRAIG